MGKNKNIENFLKQVSKKDSGWLEKAKWRQENEDWLDVSFNIAIKVASTLSANKRTGTFPKSQVELADAMECSPQYVNKLLKGQENLQIETICKIGRISDIKTLCQPNRTLIKRKSDGKIYNSTYECAYDNNLTRSHLMTVLRSDIEHRFKEMFEIL